jgi:hypothetical protein
MARWVKKRQACREKGIGVTKMNELIAQGLVRAKKEAGGMQGHVWIDTHSYDSYIENLPDAQGSISISKKHQREPAPEHP